MGSGCTQPALGRSGPLCLPTSSHFGQSGREDAELPVQENHCDCSSVAQHALVMRPSGHIETNPIVPAKPTQPFESTLQSDPSHESVSNLNLHAWLLEPQISRSRASLILWQHELRLLKESQPDQSMRQSGPFLQSGAK